MIREDIIHDLNQVAKYLADYPSVKGSEAGMWAQVLGAVSAIAKELEEYNKNQEVINSEMIEALEE